MLPACVTGGQDQVPTQTLLTFSVLPSEPNCRGTLLKVFCSTVLLACVTGGLDQENAPRVHNLKDAPRVHDLNVEDASRVHNLNAV